MERKKGYCLLFLLLLVPYTTMGAILKGAPPKQNLPDNESEERFVWALPSLFSLFASIPAWVAPAIGAAAGALGTAVVVDAVADSNSYPVAISSGGTSNNNGPTDCDDVLGTCDSDCIPEIEMEIVAEQCGTKLCCMIAPQVQDPTTTQPPLPFGR